MSLRNAFLPFLVALVLILLPSVKGHGQLGPYGGESHCFTHCTSFSPDLPAGCVRARPDGLQNRGLPLWIYKGWTSLDMTSMMAKILLRDVLGYRNITLAWGAWKHNLEPLRSMGGPSSSIGETANVCKDSDGTPTPTPRVATLHPPRHLAWAWTV